MPIASRQHRLQPELVPRPLWGRSIYRSVRRSLWDQDIRQKVMETAQGVCQCCGAEYAKGMICHEVWQYHEESHTAELAGFKLICRDCNFVHHIGKASTLGQADDAVAHLARVNGIGIEEAKAIVSEAAAAWLKRSLIEDWRITVSEQAAAQFPFLRFVDI